MAALSRWSSGLLMMAGVSLFSGCSFTPAIGSKPDVNPPKIVVNKDGLKSWDRPGAFGPVPANLVAKGSAVCAGVGEEFVAKGFHPGALNQNGQAFADGGFFCAPK